MDLELSLILSEQQFVVLLDVPIGILEKGAGAICHCKSVARLRDVVPEHPTVLKSTVFYCV